MRKRSIDYYVYVEYNNSKGADYIEKTIFTLVVLLFICLSNTEITFKEKVQNQIVVKVKSNDPGKDLENDDGVDGFSIIIDDKVYI